MCSIRNVWRTTGSCYESVVYMKDLPSNREIVLIDSFGEIIGRLRITFTANVRNDHLTMFILYLPLSVSNFLVKLSSFALASKVRIICTNFFKKT